MWCQLEVKLLSYKGSHFCNWFQAYLWISLLWWYDLQQSDSDPQQRIHMFKKMNISNKTTRTMLIVITLSHCRFIIHHINHLKQQSNMYILNALHKFKMTYKQFWYIIQIALATGEKRQIHSLYSFNGQTSYCQISWRLAAAKCLWNFRVLGKVWKTHLCQ